jgi:AcrR family transcriptional regulator
VRTPKLATEIRRDQIAGAALQIIAARGMRGLSLASVARRIGLVPSAIYRHFAGKDEIIDATLDHIGGRLHGNLDRAANAATDPLDRLHHLLSLHVGLVRESQAVPQIFFSEEVFGGKSERKARVRALMMRYLEGVAEFLRDGQSRGIVRADLDPRAAAIAFLGVVQPAAILWQMSDGEFDVTRQTERAWRIYRAGIAAPEGSARPARVARHRSGPISKPRRRRTSR